jgi:hypothetical protein
MEPCGPLVWRCVPADQARGPDVSGDSISGSIAENKNGAIACRTQAMPLTSPNLILEAACPQ